MPANMRVTLSRAILPIAGYWSLLLALSIQAQSPSGYAEFVLPAIVLMGLPLVVLASIILFRGAHASGSLLAMRDDLTGVGNRRAFTIQSQTIIRKAKPGSLGLILLDVDGLKTLNDTCGHQAGDELLEKVAEHVSALGNLYRIGGDEFAILVDRSAGQQASPLIRALEPFVAEFTACGHSHAVSVSFGSTSNRENEEFRDLFKRADDSLILHKRQQHHRGHTNDPRHLARVERESHPAPDGMGERDEPPPNIRLLG